ncbi:MAG: hypothetical protein AAFR26_18080 [Cyanobacteria bacterium J06626_4]
MNDVPALRRQIEGHLEGHLVWLARDHVHRHDGLSQAIRGSIWAEHEVYAEALCQLLGSTDIRHRTGAIAVLTDVMPPLRSDRALACLGQISTQPPAWPIGYPSLEQAAAIALATKATPADVKTIAWLKSLVLQRPYAHFLWVHLARLDPAWLIQQVHHIKHKMLGVIAALPESQRAVYIAVKAPWPPEMPTVLTRAFWRKLPVAEAQRLRSLMYPADQLVFVYQIGNEYAPDDPFGCETLSLTPAGRLTYQRQQRGQVWQQETNVDPQLLEILKAALADAQGALMPQLQIPPSTSLVQIRCGDQQVSVDYFQAQKRPGYAQIIEIMNAHAQAFRQAEK